jgi:hypothetical protein
MISSTVVKSAVCIGRLIDESAMRKTHICSCYSLKRETDFRRKRPVSTYKHSLFTYKAALE